MSHLAALLVELGLLFIGLSLVGMLARRASLSSVPFVLLAGLAFGQGGFVALDASLPFVQAAAEIGVLLLLLTLGLEFSAPELVSSLRRHTPSGLVDLALNAPVGFVAGMLNSPPPPSALFFVSSTRSSVRPLLLRTPPPRSISCESPAVASPPVTVRSRRTASTPKPPSTPSSVNPATARPPPTPTPPTPTSA